ncbi:MAG: NapC/NirT family cytochrome c, partial [Thermodesulfobacteriota bacterium]
MINTMLKQFIVVGIVLISGIAFAQGGDTSLQFLEKPYQVVSDPVQWAKRISLVLAILAIILIAFMRVSVRLRINIPSANLQRFVYLLILPFLILVFASFSTFEESTKVEFCGSCHSAMGIYVDDMKDKSSNTLAATHYKNRFLQHGQCYQCHAGYRVVEIGKAKGTGLLHFYYWITGTPTGSGEEQIKLYREGGYSNDLCLRCHSGSKVFLEAGEGVHKKVAEYIIENPDTGISKMSCLKCHGPAHLSLAETKAPKIFTGRGLVSGQQGKNIFPAEEPGKSRNLDRPYEGAPPAVPHNILE